MPANYLHGVETIEVNKGSRPVNVVKSAVIALVGTAPKGAKNALKLCLSDVDDAQFGSPLSNFTIPQALRAIRAQGPATVVVVNVYDETLHTDNVTAESNTVTDGKIKLEFEPVTEPVLSSQAVSETRATATYTITGGTASAGNQLTQLAAGSTNLMVNPVLWATSHTATAAAVAAEINADTGSHGYTATSAGAVVSVKPAVGQGATANGRTLTGTVGGNVTGTATNFSGGVTAVSAVTFVKGTDYDIDPYGNVVILNFSTMPETSTVLATYKKFVSGDVQSSEIIGEVDPDTQERTGLKLFDLLYNSFGFTGKIFIAPNFSTSNVIAAELIVTATKFRGVALIDAPQGISPSDAVTGRGPLGQINLQTSSKNAALLYPWLKAYDTATDSVINVPYSPYFAGVIANTDYERGYWVSPSNKEIKGIVGIERPISFAINDAQSEANLLNEKGIITVANGFGTGLRTWGNRNGSFPQSTLPVNFISVQRTQTVIHESVEYAMLQFIDEPLIPATIDAIRSTVDAFLRKLIGDGAIVDGGCTFDPAKNPTQELAAGHITFDITFMPPTPAERITFSSFIDKDLLTALYPAQ